MITSQSFEILNNHLSLENKKFSELKSKGYRDGIKRKKTR